MMKALVMQLFNFLSRKSEFNQDLTWVDFFLIFTLWKTKINSPSGYSMSLEIRVEIDKILSNTKNENKISIHISPNFNLN